MNTEISFCKHISDTSINNRWPLEIITSISREEKSQIAMKHSRQDHISVLFFREWPFQMQLTFEEEKSEKQLFFLFFFFSIYYFTVLYIHILPPFHTASYSKGHTEYYRVPSFNRLETQWGQVRGHTPLRYTPDEMQTKCNVRVYEETGVPGKRQCRPWENVPKSIKPTSKFAAQRCSS